ncbi:MAG: matrixin family metalloprotease [Microthrixaceae bacterium]
MGNSELGGTSVLEDRLSTPGSAVQERSTSVRPRRRVHLFSGVAALLLTTGLLGACAPPAPPSTPPPTTATPTAPPTTTAPPSSSLYSWSTKRARSTYVLDYKVGTPSQVITAFENAASAVTAASGITFTSGTASGTTDPAIGEIRVQLGAFCTGNEYGSEAGCARTWYSGDRLISADVSITTPTSTSDYLGSVALHELAHSVGLNHVDPAVTPKQIMHPVVDESINTYQNGDLAGLGVVGQNLYAAQGMGLPAAILFPSASTHAITVAN